MKTLSSSPLALGSIANAMTGAGSLIAGIMIGSSRVGQPVAGARLLELGDGADVAGAERVGVLGLLALEHEQLADALLGVRARVEHLVVVAHHALVDAEEVHTTNVCYTSSHLAIVKWFLIRKIATSDK